MPPKLAFLLGILFVAFVYRVVERRRAANVFPALFLPLLWYILVSSRSTGVWLSVLGVPLPSGGGDTEGSIVDRTVYFVLCLIGLCILSRRNIEWGPTVLTEDWAPSYPGETSNGAQSSVRTVGSSCCTYSCSLALHGPTIPGSPLRDWLSHSLRS